MHGTNLWLAFPTRLLSTQHHEYALPHLPDIYQKPLKYERLYIPEMQCGSYGVRIRGVPLPIEVGVAVIH